MAKGKSIMYKEDRIGDEALDEIVDKGTAKEGHWRPPYGLIAALCVLFLLFGFGGGFGAGWAAKPSSYAAPQTIELDNDTTKTQAPENVEIIRGYQPIDFTQNISNDAVRQHYEQSTIISPALNVLTMIISTLGGVNNTYDPNVVRIFLYNKYLGKQDTLARIFQVAQRLQVPDFQDRIYDIATSMVDIFKYIRNNEGKIGGMGGRRLLEANSAEPLAVQVLRAFLKSGLQAPELQGAREALGDIWPSADDIVDLVADILTVIKGVAAQISDIHVAQEEYHPSLDRSPPPEIQQVVVAGGLEVKVTVGQAPPLIVGEVGDDIVEDDGPSSGSHHRRLLQSGQQVTIPLPAGFVAAMPASQPNVLIPTVWHIMLYRNADGTYGPPGYESACDMIKRLIIITNFRLAPSKFQLFLSECRNDPVARPYLVKNSRDEWLACTSGGYFYLSCGSIIPNSITDFPRSINYYVAGEQPPTSWTGYAWVPGSTTWPMEGHVGMTWTSISTLGANNRGTYESGTSAMVHETLHHLGMDHTFNNDDCTDADSKFVTDTPVSFKPVWNQPWAMQAAMACMNVWNRMLATNWDTANRQASTRIGITPTEQGTKFDSCPNQPNSDEIANHITYTYDICLLALGHLTTGQVSAMHKITADSNPTLYAWGQYYAQNPPAGANNNPVARSSPPPPSASPPPAGGSTTPAPAPCRTISSRGCTCKSSWFFSDATYTDCTIVPGYENRGPWCSVDLSTGNCANPRNGWWDTCTPSCSGGGGGGTGTPAPTPSPSPPPPASTGGDSNCGPSARTKSGGTCTANAWKIKNSEQTYLGCANPTNDVNGAWCVLVKGTSTPAGAAWDYCLDACKSATGNASTTSGGSSSGGTSTPTYPAVRCTSNYINLPNTCTCASPYTMTFQSTGATYYNQVGCTNYAESRGSGMCVYTCTDNRRSNNKAGPCGCA